MRCLCVAGDVKGVADITKEMEADQEQRSGYVAKLECLDRVYDTMPGNVIKNVTDTILVPSLVTVKKTVTRHSMFGKRRNVSRSRQTEESTSRVWSTSGYERRAARLQRCLSGVEEKTEVLQQSCPSKRWLLRLKPQRRECLA